jgi:hypothetical protein
MRKSETKRRKKITLLSYLAPKKGKRTRVKVHEVKTDCRVVICEPTSVIS